MAIIYALLLIVGFHVLVVGLAFVLYGLSVLGHALWLQLGQLFTMLRFWSRHARQVREIRRIGHRARRAMQQLYTTYMAQIQAQKGG